jgi:hypothetical protein
MVADTDERLGGNVQDLRDLVVRAFTAAEGGYVDAYMRRWLLRRSSRSSEATSFSRRTTCSRQRACEAGTNVVDIHCYAIGTNVYGPGSLKAVGALSDRSLGRVLACLLRSRRKGPLLQGLLCTARRRSRHSRDHVCVCLLQSRSARSVEGG